MRRLGVSMRDGVPPPVSAPTYDDVVLWYDDLATAVNEAVRSCAWQRLLGDRAVEARFTSRAKTVDTLTQELVRHPTLPLADVQDIAGVRFEAEMTIAEQYVVVGEMVRLFEPHVAAVKDLREDAHSGYRAVHVWLRPPAGRIEVQVRTHVQGAWANAYEALAEIAGREIRYGDDARDSELEVLVTGMHRLSLVQGVDLEESRVELIKREAVAEDGFVYPDLDLMKEVQRVAERTYTEDLQRLETAFRHARERGVPNVDELRH